MLTPEDKQIVRAMCSDVLNASTSDAEDRALAKLRLFLSPDIEQRVVIEIASKDLLHTVWNEIRRQGPPDLRTGA